MFRLFQVVLLTCFLFTCHLRSQVQIAITQFTNQSEQFYLESWEKLIPDLLRTNLSSNEDIIILARDKLDEVLKEHALSQTGVINPEQVQKISDLLGAEFIITGSVNTINNEIRIAADIIRVKTGKVKTESVSAPDQKYLDKMINFLSDNIIFELTREGDYRNESRLRSSKIWYYLGATVGFGLGALVTNQAYQDNWNLYKNTSKLDKFDLYYDRANTQRKWYYGFAALTAVSLGGTLISWIQNQNAPTIHAFNKKTQMITPVLYVRHQNEISIGAKIYF